MTPAEENERTSSLTGPPPTGVRRRRVKPRRTYRSVLIFLVATAAMVLIVAANRDHDARRACHKRLTFVVQQLQMGHDRQNALPMALPLPAGRAADSARPGGVDRSADPLGEDMPAMRNHYVYRPTVNLRGARPIGICSCADRHSAMFDAAGRHVVSYDPSSGRFDLVWMDETEFQARAAELGLKLSSAGP